MKISNNSAREVQSTSQSQSSFDVDAHKRASWTRILSFGSQADPGYAEQMRAMNGREDEDPQRQDPPTFGSS